MSPRRSALAAFAAFGVLWGGWAALVPTVQHAVGASKGGLGLALLCVGLGSLPAMLLVGPAIDRHGSRILPLALVALALAALPLGFVGSLPALALALLAVGATSGVVDVGINAEAASIEAETGTRLMQLAHAFFSIGVLAGALAVGAARQAGAGRLPILAAIGVVLCVAAAANRNPLLRPSERPRARTFLHGAALAFGAICAASFLIEGAIENWSALFLVRQLGAGPGVSALGPASYAVAMVTGRLSGQALSNRLGDRLLLGLGGVTTVVGVVVAAAAPAVPVALVGFFLGGAGVATVAPIAFGAAGRNAREEERGSAVATVTTVGYTGFLAGPPIVGAVAQATSLRVSFLLLGVVAAAIAAAATRIKL